MNEEEKKAIEELSKKAVICKYESRDYPNMICFKKDMIIVLNLIEKLQKENKKYKRLAKINLKDAEEFKDNMCEHRCLLKSENEELQRENEELKQEMEKRKWVHIKENGEVEPLFYISKDKIREKIEEEKLPLTIVGGRKNKKTLEYGIKLGRRQALQELIEERGEKNHE